MRAFDVAVIGQGYAGLCAARLARKRGLSVITFEGVMAGGSVMTVLRLQPSPEDFTTSGPDLGAAIGMKNIDAGVVSLFEPVTTLEPGLFGGWRLSSPDTTADVRHVVLAMGSAPRRLQVPGEAALDGRGVSHCADCDGPLAVDRDCVVVGGGDAAFQEAAVLARVARSVTVLMRGEAPRARPDLVSLAVQSGRVEMVFGRRVTEVLGDNWVTGVVLDGGPDILSCQGVFVFIGGEPQTQLLPSAVPRDEWGGILCDERGALDLPGLWAVGSVRSGFVGGLTQAGEDAGRAVEALGA